MKQFSKVFLIVCLMGTFLTIAMGGTAEAYTLAHYGGNGFAISLAANPQIVWVNQSVTVTATANADVGPTPYYITIYDQTAQTYVAICGSGSSCGASVSQSSVSTHNYMAYVSDYPTNGNPPFFIVATSNIASVAWWQNVWHCWVC